MGTEPQSSIPVVQPKLLLGLLALFAAQIRACVPAFLDDGVHRLAQSAKPSGDPYPLIFEM